MTVYAVQRPLNSHSDIFTKNELDSQDGQDGFQDGLGMVIMALTKLIRIGHQPG